MKLTLSHSSIDENCAAPELTKRNSFVGLSQVPSEEAQLKRPQKMHQEPDRSKGSVYQWDDERFLKTKVRAAKLNQASVVLQRFFLQTRRQLQQFQKQQSVLARRLQEIETAKQQDLDSIALEIEQRKAQLMQEMRGEEEEANQRKESQQSAQEALVVIGTAINEMTTEMKRYKKRNAFLQRRCTELRRDNAILRADLKRAASLQSRLHNVSIKLPAVICARTTALKQYQRRVAEYQTKFEQAEKQWQTMKLLNKHLRESMSKIIQTLEVKLQPETNEKLELVDELYKLQRGTKWKGKCNAGVKSRRPQSQGSKISHPSKTSAKISRRPSRPSKVGASFPRNSPRRPAALKNGSRS